MEEKILIKSVKDEKAKNAMLAVIGVACFVFVFSFFPLISPQKELKYTTLNGFSMAFYEGDAKFLVIFVLFCLSAIAVTIAAIMFFAHSNCELIITDKNVKGRTLYGKEVVLPLYMVSAFSTKAHLSVITISTSSGLTQFSLVSNYREIGEVLSKMINERQENTVNQTTVISPVPQSNAMDDLKKLKDLLDSGIITQEEFDAKKKQLLDL